MSSATTAIYGREQEAKKLFGFAVRKDPQEFYDLIEQPNPSKLPSVAAHQIVIEYSNAHYESEASDLLLAGLADTQTFVLNIIKEHPDISFEKALEISQHKRTVRALAILARQSQAISLAILRHPMDSYDLSSDQEGIELAGSIKPSRGYGCPAVEYIAGNIEPLPIFNRFAPWAAKLAIISYYDHK